MGKGSALLVRLSQISAHYGSHCALDKVDLEIRSGDFLAVIGPNGGGKTTLLKVILRLLKPSGGQLSFPCWEETKRKSLPIAWVPQAAAFQPDFPATVREVALMGLLVRSRLTGADTRADEQRAAMALEKVDMRSLANVPIGSLSRGQQQRVFLARALAMEPELLLLDEPMANIESPTRKDLYELLKNLYEGVAIVLVTHDVGAISLYVNKVACLNKRLFYHGTPELEAETLEKTYQCPIQLIAHGFPHRVLKEHE